MEDTKTIDHLWLTFVYDSQYSKVNGLHFIYILS